MEELCDFRGVLFRQIFIAAGTDAAEDVLQRRLRGIMRSQPRFRKGESRRPLCQEAGRQAWICCAMKRCRKKKQGTQPKRSQKCSARKLVACFDGRSHPGVLAERAILAQIFFKAANLFVTQTNSCRARCRLLTMKHFPAWVTTEPTTRRGTPEGPPTSSLRRAQDRRNFPQSVRQESRIPCHGGSWSCKVHVKRPPPFVQANPCECPRW